MGDASGGYFRFPASLDPQANEFRPRNHHHDVITPHHLAVIPSPPQPFYYQLPPPLPPPPVPFVGGGAVIGYQQDPFPNHSNYDCTPPRVRAVQMERIRDGIVTVHFYDLRHAEAALRDHHHLHMHHHNNNNNSSCPFSGWSTVWAQFTIPSIHAMPEGQNQGTIVVFNLDPNASASYLRHIFQSHGAVKEIRETPMKRQQRFAEFHDLRDAARVLNDMNGMDILGKPVVIKFSRPDGLNKKLSFINSSSSSKITTPKFIPLIPPARRFTNSPPPPLAPWPIVRRNSSIELPEKGIMKFSQSKPWKGGKAGRNCNNLYDSRYLINDDEPFKESSSSSKKWSSSSTDLRTTVMIKNIPNNQKLLLNMLDNHCNEQITNHDDNKDGEEKKQPFSSYNFLYLPIDFKNKCNVGYGFVNMTSPEGARRLHKAFNNQHWEVFNSKKICEVTYARVQVYCSS